MDNRREAIADIWYNGIARTSFTALTAVEVRPHVTTLVEEVIVLLMKE